MFQFTCVLVTQRKLAQEFPNDHNDDLIVIGATGLSAVERLVVGSILTMSLELQNPMF